MSVSVQALYCGWAIGSSQVRLKRGRERERERERGGNTGAHATGKTR